MALTSFFQKWFKKTPSKPVPTPIEPTTFTPASNTGTSPSEDQEKKILKAQEYFFSVPKKALDHIKQNHPIALQQACTYTNGSAFSPATQKYFEILLLRHMPYALQSTLSITNHLLRKDFEHSYSAKDAHDISANSDPLAHSVCSIVAQTLYEHTFRALMMQLQKDLKQKNNSSTQMTLLELSPFVEALQKTGYVNSPQPIQVLFHLYSSYIFVQRESLTNAFLRLQKHQRLIKNIN